MSATAATAGFLGRKYAALSGSEHAHDERLRNGATQRHIEVKQHALGERVCPECQQRVTLEAFEYHMLIVHHKEPK